MTPPKKNKDDLKRSLKSYAKYSSLGLQMGALIFMGAYGGKWLDAQQSYEKPWFTLVGTLGGMGFGLYLFLRGIKSDQDD